MTDNTSSTATVDHRDETAGVARTDDGDGSRSLPPGLDIEVPDELEFAERTYVHEDEDYCAQDTDGRVVVGVTNRAGEVLLLVNDGHSHAILPNCHVEDGDWADVARRTVENSTGVTIELDGPEVVRAVDHEIDGDGDDDPTPDGRTYHVVFRATPTEDGRDADPTCEEPDWRTGWYDEIPYDIDPEHGDVIDDIERFLE